MRYKIVEVELATKTINPADPTSISKKVGEEVVGEARTFEEAQEKLMKLDTEEQESYEMSLSMCGGDSELMGPQNTIERYVFDTIEQKVFQLGIVETGTEKTEFGNMPIHEPLLMPFKDVTSITELYGEGWQM